MLFKGRRINMGKNYEQLAYVYLELTKQVPTDRIETKEGRMVISRTKLFTVQEELKKLDMYLDLLGYKGDKGNENNSPN
jgi:hypothetical protein